MAELSGPNVWGPKESNLDKNFFYLHGDLKAVESSSHHPLHLLTILLLHSPAQPCLTTELCPINFWFTLPRQKGPNKEYQNWCSVFHFSIYSTTLKTLYTFSIYSTTSHSETYAKIAPTLVFPWQDSNSGLGSFPYPLQSEIFTSISVQKFWELCLIHFVTFILVQHLINSKYLIGLLSEGINKDSYFWFLLEAVSLGFSASLFPST